MSCCALDCIGRDGWRYVVGSYSAFVFSGKEPAQVALDLGAVGSALAK